MVRGLASPAPHWSKFSRLPTTPTHIRKHHRVSVSRVTAIEKRSTMATTFTPFPRLPIEIQDAIWTEYLLLQPPSPEVCIVSPPVLKKLKYARGHWNEAHLPSDHKNCDCILRQGPILPLTVDTAWPAIAHLSRSARSFFFRSAESDRLKSLGIPIGLRLSRLAGNIQVPYRLFDPQVDTLYWSAYQHDFMTSVFFRQPEHRALVEELRHIAIELAVVFCHRPPHDAFIFPRRFHVRLAPRLETTTYVLPGTTPTKYNCRDEYGTDLFPNTLRVPGLEFLPPGRRCRLTKLSDEVNRMIKLDHVPPGLLYAASDMGLFREKVSPDGPEEHNSILRKWLTVDEYLCAEPRSIMKETKIDIQTAVFEEWQATGSKLKDERGARDAGRWVEVCWDRANAGEYWMCHYSSGKRKDPEQYRVLDDGAGSYEKEPWSCVPPGEE